MVHAGAGAAMVAIAAAIGIASVAGILNGPQKRGQTLRIEHQQGNAVKEKNGNRQSVKQSIEHGTPQGFSKEGVVGKGDQQQKESNRRQPYNVSVVIDPSRCIVVVVVVVVVVRGDQIETNINVEIIAILAAILVHTKTYVVELLVEEIIPMPQVQNSDVANGRGQCRKEERHRLLALLVCLLLGSALFRFFVSTLLGLVSRDSSMIMVD